jgi:dihydroxyacid dehydratase/phosphogluconate dehydratase
MEPCNHVHLLVELAIVHAANAKLALDDFTRLGKCIPVLADLKPGGNISYPSSGGTLALVKNSDPITIVAQRREIDLEVSSVESRNRYKAWKAPRPQLWSHFSFRGRIRFNAG